MSSKSWRSEPVNGRPGVSAAVIDHSFFLERGQRLERTGFGTVNGWPAERLVTILRQNWAGTHPAWGAQRRYGAAGLMQRLYQRAVRRRGSGRGSSAG